MELPTPDDAFDVDFLRHIDDPGWGVIVVPPDDDGPGFAFSVGLFYTHQHPELIVTGLPDEVATEIINVAGDLIAEGQRFDDGTSTDQLIDGFACQLKAVADARRDEFLGYLTWFYQQLDHPVPALQVLWPDAEGVLPDQPGYDEAFRELQPELWRP